MSSEIMLFLSLAHLNIGVSALLRQSNLDKMADAQKTQAEILIKFMKDKWGIEVE